jgi:Protein of unknown function (DUF1573)
LYSIRKITEMNKTLLFVTFLAVGSCAVHAQTTGSAAKDSAAHKKQGAHQKAQKAKTPASKNIQAAAPANGNVPAEAPGLRENKKGGMPMMPLRPDEMLRVQRELMENYPGTPPFPEPEINNLHMRHGLFETGHVTEKDKKKIAELGNDNSDPMTANKLKMFAKGPQMKKPQQLPVSAEEMRRKQAEQNAAAAKSNIDAAPVQVPQPQMQNQQPAGQGAADDLPKFEFTGGDLYNYGDIYESPTPAEHIFEFKNVGKKPLVISEAHGSCGCTVPTWPKEPILPGMTGTISVKYSTQGRQGPINKEVTINSNAAAPYVLHIRGNVKPANATPATDK